VFYIPFILSQLGAEFAVFSPRVAQKGNSNVLAHVSSIRVFTVSVKLHDRSQS